jgi:ketosteroid isomerase-like protein
MQSDEMETRVSAPAADEGGANLAAAARLYSAFEARDAEALLELLAPDFRGVVSAGMPEGLGGAYQGPERMLRDCWGRALALLDTRPVPEEYLAVDGASRVVVLGHYRGAARRTGRPHEASFAHVLRFRAGRVVELIQITDTQRWHRALYPEPPGDDSRGASSSADREPRR